MDLFKIIYYLQVFTTAYIIGMPICLLLFIILGFPLSAFTLIMYPLITWASYHTNPVFIELLEKWGFKK